MTDLRGRVAGLSPEQRALLGNRLAAKSSSSDASRTSPEAIAIVSAACRLPGHVRSPADFWRLLIEGRDAVIDVPADRWDASALFSPEPDEPGRMNTRWGGFLDNVDQFDAAFFGISPREASLMDPQQRLLLETAWEALEAGGHAADRLAGSQTGVFVGAHSHSSDYYLLQLAQAHGIESHMSTGSAHSILANRISYLLDLHGPSMAVDTACSSSLVAVHLACQSLRTHECDLALAGGVNLMLLPPASMAFSKLEILSSDGRCRSFDASANGIVRGEGCGLVLLKRLGDALRDRDPILAIIRGSAVNQDGASNGLTAPNGPAQEAVLRRALSQAGIAPERLGLVETHGTGTPLGDPVEVEALSRVIGPQRSIDQVCHLGAVKTNIGHLEAAAGIAGLIKAVLCLKHRRIPPNLHFSRLNPHIDLSGTPFVVPTAAIDWRSSNLPRVAGVSSFGFGGTNAHVVLEEHVVESPTPVDRGLEAKPRVFAVSARSAVALRELMLAHRERLAHIAEQELPDYLHTTNAGRAHGPFRVAVHGATPAEFVSALTRRIEALEQLSLSSTEDNGAAQGVVFLYSGQGGQWPTMGRELFECEPAFRDAVVSLSTRFEAAAGWNLLDALIDPSQEARLADTEVAQPAIFALQIGLTALWRERGVSPAAIAGHSVGEVAAAHIAGVITLDEAVMLIWHRSRLMQPARGAGRMAQIELAPSALQSDLTPFGQRLSMAAFNGPSSTVVAGESDALDVLLRELNARGVANRVLPVAYAFHSSQMDPFCRPLMAALRALKPKPATIPLVSTVTGKWSTDLDFGAAYWARNIREPVQLVDALGELLGAGFRAFLEIGPHPALAAAVHACAPPFGAPVEVAYSLRRGQPARAEMLSNLAALYEAGCSIDWHQLSEGGARIVDVPGYAWQRQRCWVAPPDVSALGFHVTGRRSPGASPDAPNEPTTEGYALAWQPAPINSGLRAAIDIPALAERIEFEATTIPDAAPLARDEQVLSTTGLLADMHVLAALRELGFRPEAGQRVGLAAGRTAGVVARHERLWARLMEMLAEHGALRPERDDWVMTEAAQRLAIGPSLMAPSGSTLDSPPRIELALLDRCGRALADVLRGKVDPLTLLFPDDGYGISAKAMYAESATARVYNQLMAKAVAEAAMKAQGQPFCVIEIGAGTGATTAAVLADLPAGTQYFFTDISPTLLSEAKRRFRSSAIKLNFRVLDIEQSPLEQGFTRGHANVVLASNVVHATGDLRATLLHARELLAPGGLLVLLETVATRYWQTLTFGLTSGWWRFRDLDLRSKDPIIPTEQWMGLLRECGFDAVSATAEALSQDGLHPQAVLLARAATDNHLAMRQADSPGTWLVITDYGGVGAEIERRMAERGARTQLIEANAIPEAGCRAFDKLVESLDGANWCGTVHCATLDAPDGAHTNFDEIDAALDSGLYGAFRVAQLMAASRSAQTPRLWIATRGAQYVEDGGQNSRSASPISATLWGLGRTLALELSTIWGGLIDIGRDVDDEAAADCLVREIELASSRTEVCEEQIAWRASGRYVARLVRRPNPAPARPVLASRGAYLVTGGFGSLGLRIARWLCNQGARHIVLLGRSVLPERREWRALPADHRFSHCIQAIRELEAEGVTVRLECLDVTDRGRMSALFAELDAAGETVRGVVHAAADFQQAPLAEVTPQMLRRAAAAKLQGAWLLHELTRELRLDLFVLFSSITGLLGAKHLAAYAAANQFLVGLANHRYAAGLPATCVDWGTWSEQRADARGRRGNVEEIGFRDLDDERAFDLLSSLVFGQIVYSAVARIDWKLMSAAHQARGSRPFLEHLVASVANVSENATPDAAVDTPLLARRLASMSRLEQTEQVEALVRLELGRVLGLANPDEIEPSVGFSDLGLDSLMALQLRRRLTVATGLELPATLTFNYPTLAALSSYLIDCVGSAEALGATAIIDAPRAEALISDDDVHAMLLAEINAVDGESPR
jgi:acyl transferase domain-containing protein/acyl carrier protein